MRYLILILLSFVFGGVVVANEEEKYWDEVYDARTKFVEQNFGKLPDDILKMLNMSGVWPGGGLYKFKADKLGPNKWVYMTFGFTNPDMPTNVAPSDQKIESVDGQVSKSTVTLQKKQNVASYPGRLGYGYEVLVITENEQEWPLGLLQWVVNAEIIGDADILGRVEQYNGLTVEDIRVYDDYFVNVLFQKAQKPIPLNLVLPSAAPFFVIATVITDDEMTWSKTKGRDELLKKLLKSNVGQTSYLSRPSIINPRGVDYTKITSVNEAQKLYSYGLLRKAYLFPLEFGGHEIDANTIYLPRQAALQKKLFEEKVIELAQDGLIDNYSAKPEYEGKSFIPKKILLEATGKDNIQNTIEVF